MQIRNGKNSSAPSLDAVDYGIIDILRTNGRATNQEIADRLSITAATVSARLQKMEDAHAVRVVAVTDFSAFGYNVIIALGVMVKGRPIDAVGRDLAALPEMLGVNLMSGGHDIELLVALHDFAEIGVMLQHVGQIEGVESLSPALAVDIMKFEFNVAPL